MTARFGDGAAIHYLDASSEDVRGARADIIGRIEAEGLLYPVTVVDGAPAYDGAVSYPAILRAIGNRLAEDAAGT